MKRMKIELNLTNYEIEKLKDNASVLCGNCICIEEAIKDCIARTPNLKKDWLWKETRVLKL